MSSSTQQSTTSTTSGDSHESSGIVQNIKDKVEVVVETVKDKFNQVTGSYHETDPIKRGVDTLEPKLTTGNSTITPPEQPTTTAKISSAIDSVVETVKETIQHITHHQETAPDPENVKELPQKKIDTLEKKLSSGDSTSTNPNYKERASEIVETVKTKAVELNNAAKEALSAHNAGNPDNIQDLPHKKIDTLEKKLGSGNDTSTSTTAKLQEKITQIFDNVKEKASGIVGHTPGDPENVHDLPQKKMNTLETKLESGDSAPTTTTAKLQERASQVVENVKDKASDLTAAVKNATSTHTSGDPENIKDLPQKKIDTLEKKLESGDDTATTTSEKIKEKINSGVEAVKEKITEKKSS